MSIKSKALVILSGGQDSTICLYEARLIHNEVHAITFNYGQRHAAELESARIIGEMAGVASHEFVTLPQGILKSTSPLVNLDNQVEGYQDVESLPTGLEKTFVPGRNQLFLTIAANRAYALGCEAIYIGVCVADDEGYPDCRQNFIDTMAAATNLGMRFDDNDPYRVTVCTPLLYVTKAQSVVKAATLPGCMDALAYSHTCYRGETPPCGTCHACLLRAKGFEEVGVIDPLVARTAV